MYEPNIKRINSDETKITLINYNQSDVHHNCTSFTLMRLDRPNVKAKKKTIFR